MQRKILVNRRRKEVLTKGAVIDVVIVLGVGAVEPFSSRFSSRRSKRSSYWVKKTAC